MVKRWFVAVLLVFVLGGLPAVPVSGCGGSAPSVQQPDGAEVAAWIRLGASVAATLAELAARLAESWKACEADPSACSLEE